MAAIGEKNNALTCDRRHEGRAQSSPSPSLCANFFSPFISLIPSISSISGRPIPKIESPNAAAGAAVYQSSTLKVYDIFGLKFPTITLTAAPLQ
jgi:hypothetical protein